MSPELVMLGGLYFCSISGQQRRVTIVRVHGDGTFRVYDAISNRTITVGPGRLKPIDPTKMTPPVTKETV